MREGGLPPPFRLIRLDSVGSTNDEARALAEAGAASDLLVVSARSQTKGRGRRGRTWISPPGNLHASFLIALDRPPAEAAQLGFAAAVAVAEVVSSLIPAKAGIRVRCKWPNDVLLDGRKIAGMLLEAASPSWLVLGLGIDVAAAPPPEGLIHPATCLAEYGFAGTADDVLEALCARLGPWIARWRAEGFLPVREAWIACAAGLGEPVAVRLEPETLTGTFAGLDGDGALLLDQGAAPPRRVLAGDVFFPS